MIERCCDFDHLLQGFCSKMRTQNATLIGYFLRGFASVLLLPNPRVSHFF